MSQIYKSSLSGPIPPSIPTSFVTDSGTVIPAANIININGGETNVNNDNGIRVIANPTGSNNLLVQLTNRLTGSVTTTDATPTVLIVESLGSTPGVYIVEGNLTAFDVTDTAGGAYTYIGAAITDGVTAIELGSEQRDIFESPAMATSDFSFSVSGNNAQIIVTGIAGKTIHWGCLFTYRFQG